MPPNCDRAIVSRDIEPQLSDTAVVKVVAPAATGEEMPPGGGVVVGVAGIIARPSVTLLEAKSGVSGP